MLLIMDLTRLIICRLRGAISIFILILLNLTTSMVIFIFFASAMHNINTYLENNFFSNIALREIVVMDNGIDLGIPIEADVFNDSNIEATIFMYETGISAFFLRENEIDVGYGWYLSVVGRCVSTNNSTFFNDMYDIDGQVLRGIFISESAVGYDEGRALVGEMVEFIFHGRSQSFPIIGVIPVDASFFLGRTAGHYLYIHSQLLEDNWDYTHSASARLILSDVDQVITFTKSHYSDEFELIYDEEGLRHIANVRSAVGIILLLSSVVFFLLSTVCMINGLRHLQYFNEKKNSLLRILGFSKRKLFAINMIEGLMIGCFASLGGLIVSSILKSILVRTTFIVENNISELFNVSFGVMLLSVFTSNLIILVAKIIVSIENSKTDHLQAMSSR